MYEEYRPQPNHAPFQGRWWDPFQAGRALSQDQQLGAIGFLAHPCGNPAPADFGNGRQLLVAAQSYTSCALPGLLDSSPPGSRQNDQVLPSPRRLNDLGHRLLTLPWFGRKLGLWKGREGETESEGVEA
jgi:hypothetical protein